MDIKQLKYFRMIAEEENITAAAKRLFMAQPSLSQQLKLLEDELGVQLVERGSRRIRLTESGRLLHERAGQILDLLQTTATEVKELHEGYQGTLAIGTIASSGVTLLPGLIRDFHENHPCIKFDLREGDTHAILEFLNNGIIEVGIVRSIFDLACYHWINLPLEPMIVAMSGKWNVWQKKTPISLHELADKPLLILRSNEALLRKCCHDLAFEPLILCVGDDVRSLLVLANEGIGLALIPKSALGLVPCHQLKYREISDSPLVIKKVVVWMKQRYLSAAARHFLNTLLSNDVQLT